MKQFLSTLLLALASFLMPTVMMTTECYEVGNRNETETLYKLIICGKSAKVSIPAAVIGKNKPATFHVLAIESGTIRWNIKPAAVTAVTLGTAYDCSSYYNTHATHFTLADVKSTGSYTVTLDFSASNNINNSKLTLTYAETRRLYGKEVYHRPSRFIGELPQECVEEVRLRATVSRPVNHQRLGAPIAESDTGYKLGQRVRHPKFGEGTIVNLEGSGEHSRLQVAFQGQGIKWLVAAYARLETV